MAASSRAESTVSGTVGQFHEEVRHETTADCFSDMFSDDLVPVASVVLYCIVYKTKSVLRGF